MKDDFKKYNCHDIYSTKKSKIRRSPNIIGLTNNEVFEVELK